MENNSNRALGRHLITLSETKEIPEKSRAYLAAGRAIRRSGDVVRTGESAKKLFPGLVGPSLSTAIDAFLTVRRRDTPELLSLMQLVGVGPVEAERLYDSGYTMANIDRAPMTREQEIGRRHREDFRLSIPRHVSLEIYNYIVGRLGLTRNECVLVGGFRRGNQTGNNINIAVFSRNVSTQGIVDLLRGGGRRRLRLLDVITLGPQSTRLVVSWDGDGPARQVDIRIYPNRFYGLAHATGPKELNILQRVEARENGMKVNEYGRTQR